jgi:hypothetical protein
VPASYGVVFNHGTDSWIVAPPAEELMSTVHVPLATDVTVNVLAVAGPSVAEAHGAAKPTET